jgi:serpin B
MNTLAKTHEGHLQVSLPLATELYRNLPADGNLIFSPYSVYAALSMLCAGAANHTRRQLATMLGWPEGHEIIVPSRNYHDKAKVANAFFTKPDIHLTNDFLAFLNLCGAAGFPLESAAQVNSWVSQQTNGKITDLITEDNLNGVVLALVNAIWFKDKWLREFTPTSYPFRNRQYNAVIPMMEQTDHFMYAQTERAELVQLRYEGRFDMVVILPDRGQWQPDAPNLEEWLPRMSFPHNTKVHVRMPKFRFRLSMDLIEPLKKMGLGLFDETADFSAMAEEPTYVSQMLQQAYVDVDEHGTEAAAATFVGHFLCASLAPMPPPRIIEFIVDRPFWFLIRDNETGTILFMGRVMDPLV